MDIFSLYLKDDSFNKLHTKFEDNRTIGYDVMDVSFFILLNRS